TNSSSEQYWKRIPAAVLVCRSTLREPNNTPPNARIFSRKCEANRRLVFSVKTALDNETAVIAGAARVLTTNADYDPLVGMAGEAQCVLIGEASHGTHEFYAIRAGLTRRLIQEKGF